MAEFAVCGVLQLYKQSRFFADNQAKCRWEKHRGLLELAGKTVCVVGCGDVGAECAKRFAAFGCRVVGVNIRPKRSDHFDAIILLENLDEILPQADIVVLAVPLAPETENLINEERLRLMKPGAVLVNIARGAVVDTNRLICALETHLGGAVLDVFDSEPLSADSPLWNMENVIITPHNSFVGEGNSERLWNVIRENLTKAEMSE
jgi:phosphoglycerate dehydrogenase-like enzyme